MSSARRFDSLCDTPFHTVTIGVNVVSTECLSGFRYAVNFVDEYTRFAHIYFMRTKNEVSTKLEEFISDVRRLGWRIGRIRTDLGSEYSATSVETVAQLESAEKKVRAKFEQICAREDIKFSWAPAGMSKINGVAERFQRTVSEMANAFLYQGRMSPIFWVFAYRHATWIYNRILHSTLGSYSPFELVHARRPRFDRLHTLFCDCYEWIPGPKTPGINKGRKMIYLGILETCDVG